MIWYFPSATEEAQKGARDGLSRREALLAGGSSVIATGLLTGGVLGGAMDSSLGADREVEDPFGPSITGTLKAKSEPNRLLIGEFNLGIPSGGGEGEPPSGEDVWVSIASDAQLMRTGPAQFEEYRIGDRLVVYGPQWGGNEFLATSVTPLQLALEAEVTSVEAGRVSTTRGSFAVDQETIFRSSSAASKGLSDIKRGQKILATLVEEPGGRTVAGAIGIL